jgi:hypothetical protein
MRFFIRLGWFTLIGILSVITLMQIVRVNMAAYYQNSPQEGIFWQAHNTDYLLMKAGEAIYKDPDESIKLMAQAILNKPVEAKFYLLMAHLFELKGKPSESLIEWSSMLNPYMPINQVDIANYWIRKGDGEKTLKHWGLAIEADRSLASQYFPLMLELGETGLFNQSFNELTKSNPAWWPSFFNFTLARANDEVFPRRLYDYRKTSSLLSLDERRAYIDYLLLRRYRVIEAYATWMVGLGQEYKAAFGYLIDGDFNLPPSGDGFGWRYSKATGYEVTRIFERDNTDSPSLKISFYGSKIRPYSLVTQHLMLSPGHYEFSGQYRSEDLNAGEGVRWRLTCLNQKNIAFSTLVKGQALWSNFRLEFNVPDALNCNAQTLILESVPGGERPFDYHGAVWFDQLRISKQN